MVSRETPPPEGELRVLLRRRQPHLVEVDVALVAALAGHRDGVGALGEVHDRPGLGPALVPGPRWGTREVLQGYGPGVGLAVHGQRQVGVLAGHAVVDIERVRTGLVDV